MTLTSGGPLVHLWNVLRLAVEKWLCTPEFDRQE